MQFKQAGKIKALNIAVRVGKRVPFKRFWDYVGRDGRRGARGKRVRGQYLVVKFPWACGPAPRISHDGFHPDD